MDGTGERGSASPAPGREDPPSAEGVDEERLQEGGQLPHLDAVDIGDPGGPVDALGSGAAGGAPGGGTNYDGDRGGSGVAEGELRDEGTDIAEGRDRPAGG